MFFFSVLTFYSPTSVPPHLIFTCPFFFFYIPLPVSFCITFPSPAIYFRLSHLINITAYVLHILLFISLLRLCQFLRRQALLQPQPLSHYYYHHHPYHNYYYDHCYHYYWCSCYRNEDPNNGIYLFHYSSLAGYLSSNFPHLYLTTFVYFLYSFDPPNSSPLPTIHQRSGSSLFTPPSPLFLTPSPLSVSSPSHTCQFASRHEVYF